MMNILKKRKLKKELDSVERELYFKRRELTELFKKVNAAPGRNPRDDEELCFRNKEVDRLIIRMVELDKAVGRKKSRSTSL